MTLLDVAFPKDQNMQVYREALADARASRSVPKLQSCRRAAAWLIDVYVEERGNLLDDVASIDALVDDLSAVRVVP